MLPSLVFPSIFYSFYSIHWLVSLAHTCQKIMEYLFAVFLKTHISFLKYSKYCANFLLKWLTLQNKDHKFHVDWNAWENVSYDKSELHVLFLLKEIILPFLHVRIIWETLKVWPQYQIFQFNWLKRSLRFTIFWHLKLDSNRQQFGSTITIMR